MVKFQEMFSGRKAKDVYEFIRRKGTTSKQEIKGFSGLTISTLTRLLEELMEAGLIVEVGFGESTGGRPPILYEINRHFAYLFGLEISRTHSRLVLCDMHLNKLDSISWKMDQSMEPTRLMSLVISAAEEMVERRGLSMDSILGLGVGAVGPLDRESATILTPQNFPSRGWRNVSVGDILGERLGIPVVLDNGANTGLLAEYWLDKDNRLDHLLYVHVGIGIRTAMMSGGNIVYGAVDMEGAVGQMIIQSDGIAAVPRSGNYGSWESYCSIAAIERTGISRLKQGRLSTLLDKVQDIEQLTYADFEKGLHEGDLLCREIFEQAACYFGIGLANLINILHPQKVILGGPVISGNELFFSNSVRVAMQRTYHYPVYQAKFEKSKLGEDAVAIGAAATVIQQLTK